MSEIVETDSQALNHLVTETHVGWEGLSFELACRLHSICELALELVDTAVGHKVRFGQVVVDGVTARIRPSTLWADYPHAQIWVWDGKAEKACCWRLLVRRECGTKTPSHYVLSNASDAVSVARLAHAP